MSGDSRPIIGFLDFRYDEKYGRWRALFFYRSGMTHFDIPRLWMRTPRLVILVPPSRYSRDSGNNDLGDTGIQYNMPAIADSPGPSFSRKRESSKKICAA